MLGGLLVFGSIMAADQTIRRQDRIINLGDLTLTAWAWGDENTR